MADHDINWPINQPMPINFATKIFRQIFIYSSISRWIYRTPIKTLTWVKYAHVLPPVDTTTFDCVHKRHVLCFRRTLKRCLRWQAGRSINDSITKWKFTQTKILKKCLLFLLIFQLYFIKKIGNLVPHWKELENLPKESAAAYFTHR